MRRQASLAWQRVAAGVVLAATLTGAAAAASGGSVWHVCGAVAYIAVAILALFSPGVISAQVIGGQLLAGSLLLGSDAPAAVIMLMVVSIVATAELLAVAARLAGPIERTAQRDVRRAAVAAMTAGGVFGVMLLIGELPGPAGLPIGILAVGVASGACVLLAIMLVRSRSVSHEQSRGESS